MLAMEGNPSRSQLLATLSQLATLAKLAKGSAASKESWVRSAL